MIKLPEEIVEYIISFICDRRGYNMELYTQRKKEKCFEMKRITREVEYFHHLRYSIAWLKTCGRQKKQISKFIKSLKEGNPIVTYHTGCYYTYTQELKATHLMNCLSLTGYNYL
tara:strand:- start:1988 stop:2329 length:342 start_codon:yes stop_codon:yes gene_type:complete